MSLIKDANEAAIATILGEFKVEATRGRSLQESSQLLMDCFRRNFHSVVLARTYATVPYKNLNARDRSFVHAMARDKGALDALDDNTNVLSLLGTSGAEPAWCNREESKGHLGIPLLSKSFVAEIPMVAGLIEQLGSSVDWYRNVSQYSGKEEFGAFAESFFVPDAATSRDSDKHLLIPAQDFVRSWGIRTVIGVGGQFAGTGIILACVFFTRERMLQTPPWLLRVPLMLGKGAHAQVASGRLFGPD